MGAARIGPIEHQTAEGAGPGLPAPAPARPAAKTAGPKEPARGAAPAEPEFENSKPAAKAAKK